MNKHMPCESSLPLLELAWHSFVSLEILRPLSSAVQLQGASDAANNKATT